MPREKQWMVKTHRADRTIPPPPLYKATHDLKTFAVHPRDVPPRCFLAGGLESIGKVLSLGSLVSVTGTVGHPVRAHP